MFRHLRPRVADVLDGLPEPIAILPLFLAEGLLLSDVRELAFQRGWRMAEPLAERAADLVRSVTTARDPRSQLESVSVAFMPITEAHAGRRYPPRDPYEVSAAKIAEFATALGDDNPRYRGEVTDCSAHLRRSHRRDVPGISSLAIRNWICRWRGLCTAITASLSSDPIRAGDVVIATVTIDKVRVRSGSELISTTVDMASRDGEPLCTAQATLYHAREALA